MAYISPKRLIQELIQRLERVAYSLSRKLSWTKIKKFIFHFRSFSKEEPNDCPISQGYPSTPSADVIDICKLEPMPAIKKTPQQNSSVETIPAPSVIHSAPDKRFGTAEINTLADSLTDFDLRELIKDRLSEIDDGAGNIEKQALCAVDLHDEINTFIQSYKGQNNTQLGKILVRILSEMQNHHCELIDEDTWNPEHQRAVAIAYTLPENSTPIISEKKSTGLIVNNRLIRKQEVTLLKSKI